MTRIGSVLHLVATAIFVISGLMFALLAKDTVITDAARLAAPILPLSPPTSVSIPRLYLNPDNLLMWMLLIAVWLMVLLDAVGQWIDPSEKEPDRMRGTRAFPMTRMGLLLAASLPLLIDRPLFLMLATVACAIVATIGARNHSGHNRPAIGFFAGWATALASASLAQFASNRFGLPLQAISAMAILPAAAFGMVAQMWIGSSVGYSIALIWAFCGLAISTMGANPVIAMAAILGISAMATVLVRAAS